jgi:hypothetical protein
MQLNLRVLDLLILSRRFLLPTLIGGCHITRHSLRLLGLLLSYGFTVYSITDVEIMSFGYYNSLLTPLNLLLANPLYPLFIYRNTGLDII